jgi:hypothetical protein
MPAQYVTSIVEGQDFYVSDIDPTGVVSAPRGSICLRVDNGNALVYLNATTGTAPAVGTTWTPLLLPNLGYITQLLLAANSNPALQIGPAVLLDLLKFITTTGAAQVSINTNQAPLLLAGNGGISLTGVNAGFAATNSNAIDVAKNAASQSLAATGMGAVVTATYSFPANATGVDVDTSFVLTNSRVVNIVDAYILSGGAGGAGVRVRTTVASVTDAMAPSATVNGITRAGVLANTVFAAGATLVLRTTNGTVAGTCRVTYTVG